MEKWIKSDEQLPSIYTDVLAWREGKGIIVIAQLNNEGWELQDEHSSPIIVDYWIPLPKCPDNRLNVMDADNIEKILCDKLGALYHSMDSSQLSGIHECIREVIKNL